MDTIDDTVRHLLRGYRLAMGKDPSELRITKEVYKKLVKEYTPMKQYANPALWARKSIYSLYGVPLIITNNYSRFDKNGCTRTGLRVE